MSTTIIIVLTTIVVMVATLLPTFIMSKRKKADADDWAVASRSLPTYVIVGTQFASVIGGGVLVGHVGNSYLNGVGHLAYGILMVLPFIVLMWPAKWLRKNNFSTIPEILKSFSGDSKTITVVSAIMTIIVPFGWVTSQITAFGAIYSTLTGIDYTVLCVIFACVSLFFIMPAGLKTVAWTDFIFSCFMGVMCIICIFFATSMAGGFSGIVSNVEPDLISLSDSLNKIGWGTIFLWIFAVLPGGVTNQLYFQRVCAIEDESKVNKSLLLSAITSFIAFCWAVYMGVTISSINPTLESSNATGWFMGELPVPVLAGFAALIFATMMSTVSSGVQSAVVNITRDIIPTINPEIKEEKVLKLSRLLSLITIIVALMMCLVFTDTLTWLTTTYGFSAATLLCPIYVGYACRDKKFITKEGIIASMIAGAIGAALGLILNTVINYAAVGVGLSLIVLLVVSALTKKNLDK